MNPKQAAALKAIENLEENLVLGLGTGSTVQFALEALAKRVQQGFRVQGVPSSKRTEAVALELGIPLMSLDSVSELDLTIDGADEVDPQFCMIKGGGGALLREKVLAYLSKEEWILVGKDKLVPQLGKTFLLPVEVLPFSWKPVSRCLEKLGCVPHLRKNNDGGPLLSDNDNYILDCRFDGIPNPKSLEQEIDRIPGVLESGLFIDLADRLYIGNEDGSVEVRQRKKFPEKLS